jgi:DNA-binding transcriptional MerR regulator
MDVLQEDPTIGAVSRALEVPAPTLQSWERHHQLPTGRTRTGGQRRYTADDIALLARIRDQVAAGGSAGEAATSVAAVTGSPARAVDQVVAATHRLHTQGVLDTLQQSRQTYGLAATLEQVVLPALQEIGRQWEAGGADVAHEHLLASAVHSWITAQHQQTPPPHRLGAVVLACGPGEQHTLALEAFALLLADEGVECRCLGGQTPITSLVLAATQPPATAVVVVAYLDQAWAAAVDALRAVTELPLVPFYAGTAFSHPDRRRGVPGTYLGDTLTAAAHHITDAFDTDADGQPGEFPEFKSS